MHKTIDCISNIKCRSGSDKGITNESNFKVIDSEVKDTEDKMNSIEAFAK